MTASCLIATTSESVAKPFSSRAGDDELQELDDDANIPADCSGESNTDVAVACAEARINGGIGRGDLTTKAGAPWVSTAILTLELEVLNETGILTG